MQRTMVNVLEDLIETLEDGRKGFAKAAERLRGDGYQDIAQRMQVLSDQRGRFSAELRDIAAGAGVSIEESGSAAGALHRGWIELTDALTGDDPSAVLSAAETGEDHAVREFEDALEDESLTGDLRSVVTRQADEVRSAHDEVRALRDTFDS